MNDKVHLTIFFKVKKLFFFFFFFFFFFLKKILFFYDAPLFGSDKICTRSIQFLINTGMLWCLGSSHKNH